MSDRSLPGSIDWSTIRAVGLDLMDTILRDPFREAIFSVTGLTVEELEPLRDRNAFYEFELGRLSESEYGRSFFLPESGRQLDVEALWSALEPRFEYLEGMEALLETVSARMPLHVMSNYSPWYERLRERFGLDRFVTGHFPSFVIGARKPDATYYARVLERAGLEPGELLFVDDRQLNVDGAQAAGMPALLFRSGAGLARVLEQLTES